MKGLDSPTGLGRVRRGEGEECEKQTVETDEQDAQDVKQEDAMECV